MLDIKFIRENPEIVKENIRKKFQNAKLPLVDEVIALDAERRAAINEGETLKAERNKLSKANGPLFGKLKKCADEAEKAAIQAEIDANNAAVKANAERMAHLEEKKANAEAAMNKLLLVIPQIIDESVPIGPDDSCNVEVERFGEPKTPDFNIPYHTEIMERFDGIDMDAAARVSGQGFYYLLGDIARLHSAVTGLRPGFHDRPGLHLLHSAVYDPRQRGGGRYVPDGHGRHDVQDRGRGSLPHRHQRALHDRQVH